MGTGRGTDDLICGNDDEVVEKKMIESYANKFILIKSADLKTYPNQMIIIGWSRAC